MISKVMTPISMDYPRQAMYIKFVGTHKEYDSINVEEDR